jgi:hypothetical protein
VANVTIDGLTVTTSAAAGDEIPIWRVANSDTRKITKANFIGAVLTGGGTIATGGFTLTIGANSAINGNVTGGGTLATGGFTLTVPATGTAALISTGNFTPALTFTSSTTGLTQSTQTGLYIKIGTLVYVEIDIRLSAIGSASGGARITDLPFAPLSNRAVGTVRWTALNTNFVSIIGQVTSGQIGLIGATAAAVSNGTALTEANFTNTSTLLVTMMYTTT